MFMEVMELVAAKYDYPFGDIGSHIQPIEHNRACQIEFSFFYNPDDADEKALVGGNLQRRGTRHCSTRVRSLQDRTENLRRWYMIRQQDTRQL